MSISALDFIETKPADIFSGLHVELEQIIRDILAINAKARELNGSFKFHQEVIAKLAADDLAALASSVNVLAAHVAGTLAEHVNRRSRV